MGSRSKIKLKPMDEIANRYAESAVISAIRLRRYWLSQGESEKVAIERAVKQAVGMMLASGIPPEKLIDLFDEIEGASKAFKEIIREAVKERRVGK